MSARSTKKLIDEVPGRPLSVANDDLAKTLPFDHHTQLVAMCPVNQRGHSAAG